MVVGPGGFCLQDAGTTILYVDPYLSDAVERLHGFKRLSLAPLTAHDVQTDLVVLTHEHTDHLDPDAIPIIAQNNPSCRFAGSAGCEEGLRKADVARDRMVVLEPFKHRPLGDVTIHAVPADHGDFSPSALSLVLDFGAVRIMLTGDTSWRSGLFQPLFDLKPDVVLPCINGVFGNMGHIDAARLVQQAGPRYAIPCHFWTFAEQGGGDPGGFIYACKCLCPEVEALLLKPGEGFTVAKAMVQRK